MILENRFEAGIAQAPLENPTESPCLDSCHGRKLLQWDYFAVTRYILGLWRVRRVLHILLRYPPASPKLDSGCLSCKAYVHV